MMTMTHNRSQLRQAPPRVRSLISDARDTSYLLAAMAYRFFGVHLGRALGAARIK